MGLLVIVACVPATMAQTQVTIGASKDNTLYESTTGALSNGAGQHLFVGKTATGSIRRTLIAFDIAGAVPSGATITSVALTLRMSQTSSGPDTVKLRRVSENWGEGASVASGNEGGGAPATTNDATWLHTFFDASFWSAIGGVSVATPSGAIVVNDTASYTWPSTPAMVADVQDWLDTPSSNFGWMLTASEDVAHLTKRFDSKEVTAQSARPKLTVTYNPPVGVKEGDLTPAGFALEQNYPNPFNPTTNIRFSIANRGLVSLRVFNLLGQEVATLVNEELGGGSHETTFNATGLPSGMYFYRLKAGTFVETKRLVLMK